MAAQYISILFQESASVAHLLLEVDSLVGRFFKFLKMELQLHLEKL
jgi:hypothetical protein